MILYGLTILVAIGASETRKTSSGSLELRPLIAYTRNDETTAIYNIQ